MPYNTRRKSLSLPSLGIHVPNSSRSSGHRSPPSTAPADQQHPPAKKVKRSHSTTSNASTPASPPQPSSLRLNDERPKSSGRVADTPPPSPGGASGQTKVDTQGIDDVIVVGVIEQLEKTGNRPHLLKELAAVLSTTIPIVESSVNPAAIISSRLATYLKRSWSALSKCPLDKVLVGTHPKRVYYFLTTCPRQPIPVDSSTGPTTARIITPSLSSAASEGEEIEQRVRERMSPSPEIDLSPPDFDNDPFSHHLHTHTNINIAHNRRAASPPLEHDEREFTQTASSLQQRRRSQEAAAREASTSTTSESTTSTDITMEDEVPAVVEESEESAARKNSETAAALFGEMDKTFQPEFAPSSPILKPTLEIEMPPPALKSADIKMMDDFEFRWSELKSPENVELDELDDMFGGF